jgi:hypothetical protein
MSRSCSFNVVYASESNDTPMRSMSYNAPSSCQCFVGFTNGSKPFTLFPMKTFGLFGQGESEPTQTFEGEIIVKFGQEVVIFDEAGRDSIRRVVAIISLQVGQVLRESSPNNQLSSV